MDAVLALSYRLSAITHQPSTIMRFALPPFRPFAVSPFRHSALPPFRPFALLALLALLACGPSTPVPPGATPLTTSPAISAADLKARLSILADDSMQGREAGTQGDVKATDYIAAEAGRIGLKPAGENGGWFQTVPMVVREISNTTGLEVDDTAYSPGTDFLPRDQGRGARPVDGATAIFGGVLGDSSRSLITAEQAAGKLVVVGAAPGTNGGPTGTVNRSATTALFQTAAGIAVVTLDAISPGDQADLRRGSAALPAADSAPIPTFIYVTSRFAKSLLTEPVAQAQPGDVGKLVRGEVTFTEAPPPYPARNVVAILPGKDPALKGEMVAVGAHNDHIGVTHVVFEHDSLRAFNQVMRREGANETPGVPTAEQQHRITTILDSLRKRRPPRPDSISNGADDDGSGSVGVLEIAEALAHSPAPEAVGALRLAHRRREGTPRLRLVHRHPTVPRDSIVAQLNIDMIGRGDASDLKGGGPGVSPADRVATALDRARRSHRAGEREGKHGFQFDYTYDAVGHPANYYCRSDHYMYARFGIPIAFFTTGAHEDYHQVTDEAQYIDFEKMARVVGLVEASTLAVANLDHRWWWTNRSRIRRRRASSEIDAEDAEGAEGGRVGWSYRCHLRPLRPLPLFSYFAGWSTSSTILITSYFPASAAQHEGVALATLQLHVLHGRNHRFFPIGTDLESPARRIDLFPTGLRLEVHALEQWLGDALEDHVHVPAAGHRIDEAHARVLRGDRLELVVEDSEVRLVRAALIGHRDDGVVPAIVQILPILGQRLGAVGGACPKLEVEHVVRDLSIRRRVLVLDSAEREAVTGRNVDRRSHRKARSPRAPSPGRAFPPSRSAESSWSDRWSWMSPCLSRGSCRSQLSERAHTPRAFPLMSVRVPSFGPPIGFIVSAGFITHVDAL